MSRSTTPCSFATPLQKSEQPRPRIVIESSLPSSPGARPMALTVSAGRPPSRSKACSCGHRSPRSNVSLPAGTGVCVVKTEVRRTNALASSNVRPLRSIVRAMRSGPRNAAWPSFMCEQATSKPSASTARRPPTPSRTSWRRRLSQLGRVLGDVGVEEDERDAADVDLPRGEAQRALGERDLQQERLAVLLAQAARDGEAVHVVLRVALDLPAGGVDLLLEVALAVEEADADERDVEVGGALEVVAGVHGLVQAELHREVGDHAAVRLGVALPVLRGLHLLFELRLDGFHVREERRVGGEFLEALLPDVGEQAHRVELQLAEERGRDAAEERGGVRVPAPPDVVGEAGQEGEVLGDLGGDGVGAEGRHGGFSDE